jgi:hypothetical protein
VVAIVASLLVGISPSSEANTITQSDGNDTKGPLDLAGVKVSHDPAGSVFKVTTIGAFANADVALKSGAVRGLFEVALDTPIRGSTSTSTCSTPRDTSGGSSPSPAATSSPKSERS